MKRTSLPVGVTAAVAALVTVAGVLAPAASAAPKPAAAPTNKAGELVIGSGDLPESMNYDGAVLSGASAAWNGAWASLGKAAVTPAECKVLYTGLPIPKGTDTAQTNGSARAVGWSMVVSKFAIDLAPLRAALPKCGKFKAVNGGVTSELTVRPIAVTGAPQGLGLEFVQKSTRGSQVEYLTSRQYTAVVNGMTMSLRGGRTSLQPAPFIGDDDQLAVDLLAKQILFLKNPPAPAAQPAPSAKPSAKPAASAKPSAAKPSAKPATSAAPKPAR